MKKERNRFVARSLSPAPIVLFCLTPRTFFEAVADSVFSARCQNGRDQERNPGRVLCQSSSRPAACASMV